MPISVRRTYYAWRNQGGAVCWGVIKSFADRRTVALFQGSGVRSVHPDAARRARKALLALNVATSLEDLRGAGHSLERLERERKGQWSIRVNRQWRVCFRWQPGEATDVEFTDYH